MVQNKRNLRLVSLDQPSSAKKTDTPISGDSWKGISDERMELEKNVITLIESEMNYFKTILSSRTVYKSLLETKYEKLFSLSETNLIFDDMSQLINLSRTVLIEFVRGLLRDSVLTKIEVDTEKLMHFNIPHLVYNCDLERLNVGTIIKTKIFDNTIFKHSIENLSIKYDFILSMIEEKSNVDSGVDQWLTEGKRINQVTLAVLLSKPLKRLHEYPLQLKKIMDIVDDQYDLNLSLVKVNKLINNCYDLPKIKSWDQLRDYNNQTIPKFNNNLEYRVDDYNIKTSKIRTPVSSDNQLGVLIRQFEVKYKALQQLNQVFNQYVSKLSLFALEQTKYSHLWFQVLSGEIFIESIIDKYQERMKSLLVVIENFKLLFQHDILDPSNISLKFIKDYSKLIKKLKSNKGKLVVSQNLLSCRLPRLIPLLNELCDELMYKFNHLNCGWMKAFIGDNKIKEFNKLRDLVPDNTDIVTFYHRQFTKSV